LQEESEMELEPTGPAQALNVPKKEPHPRETHVDLEATPQLVKETAAPRETANELNTGLADLKKDDTKFISSDGKQPESPHQHTAVNSIPSPFPQRERANTFETPSTTVAGIPTSSNIPLNFLRCHELPPLALNSVLLIRDDTISESPETLNPSIPRDTLDEVVIIQVVSLSISDFLAY
jgi:hypothetical protein